VVGWAVVIFTASTGWFTGARTESVIVPILAWLFPHASLETLLELHTVLRKLGHLGEYFVLGLLIARALRDERGWQLHHACMTVALAASYAMTDELHQHFVAGRTAAVADVGIDALGAAAAQVVLWLRASAGGGA
jgi:VanZ family protein